MAAAVTQVLPVEDVGVVGALGWGVAQGPQLLRKAAAIAGRAFPHPELLELQGEVGYRDEYPCCAVSVSPQPTVPPPFPVPGALTLPRPKSLRGCPSCCCCCCREALGWYWGAYGRCVAPLGGTGGTVGRAGGAGGSAGCGGDCTGWCRAFWLGWDCRSRPDWL